VTIKIFKNCAPQIGQKVYVDDSAVVIGNVTLADDVSVWPTAVLRGDVEKITVGTETNIQDGAVCHVSHASEYTQGKSFPLTIGQGVTIGHNAVVHACTVGDYCLIGINATILDGAVLEDYVMLGAGALVTPGKTLKSGYLYVGAPAKQIRALNEEEKRFLEYSARHYVELKNEYLE
jgi:carbonic anhydrase/acetyltransferase-like protein (isoleucine patch superfamily)